MKKFIRSFLIWIIMGCVGFLLAKFVIKAAKKEDAEKRYAILPAFTFFNLQSHSFNNDSLHTGQSTVFLYFNTGCEHCQYEAEQIVKHEKELQEINLLMVSRQPVQELKAFDSAYHLSSYPFIKLLRDSTGAFYKIFGTAAVPAVFIYNSKKHLVKKYLGETKIENLIRAAHE